MHKGLSIKILEERAEHSTDSYKRFDGSDIVTWIFCSGARKSAQLGGQKVLISNLREHDWLVALRISEQRGRDDYSPSTFCSKHQNTQ